MTIDEAKAVFLNRGYVEVEGGTIYDADKWRESCRVISEWLEQEPCEDTISRQNDILPNIDKKVESYKKLLKHPVIKSIMGMDETQEQLDFVQPHKRIPVTLTVSGDLISREAVLDTISELNAISFYEAQEDSKECYYAIKQAIKDLPPVKPQTGHWIEKMDACECPYCHKAWDYCDNDTEDFDYCPNCGAKLSENPTGSKDVIWYSKRNYSEIVVEPQESEEV